MRKQLHKEKNNLRTVGSKLSVAVPLSKHPGSAMRFLRLFPFLTWKKPTAGMLRSDLIAAAVVVLLAIPQSLAYAALAGMPPVTGLYALLLPAAFGLLWGSSLRLCVGPVALTSMLCMASLDGLAVPSSPEWIALAGWLSLMAGGIQVALGVFRSTWVFDLVSVPVLTGFTQAAALLIIASQIGPLMGAGDAMRQFIPALVAGQWLPLHMLSLLFGSFALAALLVGRYLSPGFPVPALVVVIAWLASDTINFGAHGGKVVGTLPEGLPSLVLPSLPSYDTLSHLALPALVIALVSFIEAMSSARASQALDGGHWDSDQELIGQGLAKIASGMSGAFPVSTSFSRSALNRFAGAVSPWSGLIGLVMTAVVLILFREQLEVLPVPVLAALIIASVLGLLQPSQYLALFRVSVAEGLLAIFTLVVTLVSAPQLHWGVLAGLLASLVHFLHQRMNPRILELGHHADGTLRDRAKWKLERIAPDAFAFRMDAALNFTTARRFEQFVVKHFEAEPSIRKLVLFAHSINNIDATGIAAFARIVEFTQLNGLGFVVCGLKLPIEHALVQARLLPCADVQLCRTESEAIRAVCAISNSVTGNV